MKLLEKLALAAGLALFLAAPSAASAEEAKAADGDKVVLHYHRADGNYEGWGLHTWESFQKKEEASDEFAKKEMSDRPLTGVQWFKPLPQTGKDDWGVYWAIPASEYGNGRVNYIIHKGDKKDQCNRDMYWMTKDSKEAWVVSGDCKVYLSKADAEKSKKFQ
jgi:hypothetical protein